MSDYASVVRRHHDDTTGFLVASRQPCITIRDDEVNRIQRRLVALAPEDLDGLDPGTSWLMGVVLCPGDDAAAVTAWARADRASRVRFYLHPNTDIRRALAPWVAAGHATNRVDVVSSWQGLHPSFGRALNDQVFADFAP